MTHAGTVRARIEELDLGRHPWRPGPFSAMVLDEPALSASLASAGLAFDGWLNDGRTWFAARRAA